MLWQDLHCLMITLEFPLYLKRNQSLIDLSSSKVPELIPVFAWRCWMSQSAITKLETPPVSSPEGLAVSLGADWDVSCGLGIAPTFL